MLNPTNEIEEIIFPIIVKTCNSFTNNQTDMEDLFSSCLEKYCTHILPKLETIENLPKFAKTLFNRLSMDFKYKKSFREHLPLVEIYDTPYEVDFDGSIYFSDFVDYIESLEQEEKDLIRSLLEKDSFVDMSEGTNLTPDQVRRKVYAGRRKWSRDFYFNS